MEITDPKTIAYVNIINKLHKNWKAHPGQVKVGRALFVNGYKSLMLNCGRKWGKNEFILYALVRWAISNPGSGCYLIGPEQKHEKEIVWASRRLQNFVPHEWVSSINETEMRIRFINGSFIKVDGSDNFDSYRGIEPHLLVLDEYKDHRPEFMQAMKPNLTVYNAPVIYIGTPPEDSDEHFYWRDWDDHCKDLNKFAYTGTSYENPRIDPKLLDAERDELYRRGEGYIWEREYLAKRVKGGINKIFPMFSKKFVFNHDDLINELSREMRRTDWILWSDPAAASCFGVLFVGVNRYTKMIYVVDEIYTSRQEEMRVKFIGDRIRRKRDKIHKYSEDWRQGYDEAEAWFCNEMMDNFNEYFEPTQKAKWSKEKGIGLIKDIFLMDKIKISDKCINFIKEIDGYSMDKNGKIKKENDHLIDCFRYILSASLYTLIKVRPKVEISEEKRAYKISDDFINLDDLGQGVASSWEKME